MVLLKLWEVFNMPGFDRSFVYAKGAYGRVANETDWNKGKDFQIVYGPYFSIRDLVAMKAESINQIIFVNSLNNVVWIKDL